MDVLSTLRTDTVLGLALTGFLLGWSVALRPFLKRTLWHSGAKFLTGLFLAWLAVTRLATI